MELEDGHAVTGSSSTELGHLDQYGCTIDGKFYTEGSQVPPSPHKPCELCYCIRNMTTCVMQECTLHVEGCQPVYHRGVCCPVRYECGKLNLLFKICNRKLHNSNAYLQIMIVICH